MYVYIRCYDVTNVFIKIGLTTFMVDFAGLDTQL